METVGSISDRSVRLSRRAIVTGLAIAPFALVACGSSSGSPTSSDTSSGTPTDSTAPDDAVRTTCATAEAELIALYDMAIASYPGIDLLTTIRDEHAAHLEALGVAGSPASAPTLPGTQAAALVQLRKAEQAAAEARTTDCGAVGDSALARLIALIAASESAHATALGSAS